MIVSYEQARLLIASIVDVAPDHMDCDGCYEMMAELADSERSGAPVSDVLLLVRGHLRQCKCCAYEYATLLEGMDALGAE